MTDAPAAAPTVRTVLVVDDNDANRYAVAFWLRDAGLRTLEATSGAEAIELATTHLPDLIVLDIRLPDTTGFEVVRVLRAGPETGAIPILHLSASYTTAEWRTHGLELGADAYLTHPVEPRELVATVRTLLRVKEVEEQLRASAHEAQAARRDAELAAARATALQAITADLAGTMTAAEVATVAMAQATRLTGATVVALGVVNESGVLELLAAEHLPDGIHPGDEGHVILAETFGSAVAAAVKG
jgi:CheY-like chemotaxis protein